MTGSPWNPLRALSQLFAALPGARARAHTMRALLDDLAEIDWRQPIWRGLVAGTAVFERYGPPLALHQPWTLAEGADGGTRIDTFMGRTLPGATEPSPRQRIALAVIRARAAVDTIAALDGKLPEQPLACYVRRVDGWIERGPLAPPLEVAFLTDAGALLARVEPGRELELARDLAAGRLPSVDPEALQATRAAVVVSLIDPPIVLARHVHRQAWTRRGGPWLGLASAPPWEVVSTCHLVLDGHGHGLVSAELFRRIDDLTPRARELATQLADEDVEVTVIAERSAYMWHHVEPMGVASHAIPSRVPFAPAAYAFGRVLTRLYLDDDERARARYSPTFMIPIAPGAESDDLLRRRRRVLRGLTSLRLRDGEFEALDEFRPRLRAMVERVMAGEDVLVRFMQAAARLPMTKSLRKDMLGGYARPSRLTSANEVLAGRGVLSTMRFTDAEMPGPPLVAVSAPPLDISPLDTRGAAILTLMQRPGATMATVTGTGLAAHQAGAEQLLACWLDELSSALERDHPDAAVAYHPAPSER